jgi:AcrR family transcriptional regulator
MKTTQPSVKARGRPRSFDVKKALDAAMNVFWQEGYEGASLSDLTGAMGISRPSLYAAFGDKESLFRMVLDRYSDGPAAFVREAIGQSTAHAVIEHLLDGAANQTTDPVNPGGCLFLQAGLACGKGAATIQQELVRRRNSGEQALRERLERAKAEGDLGGSTDPADLARYVVTVMRGMGVQAADGASREELRRVIETTLRLLSK